MKYRDLAEDITFHIINKLNGGFSEEWKYEQDYQEMVIEIEDIISTSKEMVNSPETAS